jgi:hypothetical protein
MAALSLLQNCPYMRLRGVYSQTDLGLWVRVAQACCLAHGCLSLLKRCGHVCRPEQLGPLAPTQRVGEGEEDAGGARYEAAIKIHQPQKRLQSLDVSRLTEFLDGRQVAGQRLRSLGRDAMAKEIHLRPSKLALFQVENQAKLTQPLQQLAQLREMRFLVHTGYQDVIHIDEDKIQTSSDSVH